jgi:hypothetical protein
MTNSFTESTIEQAAIDWLQELGYDYAFGPEIAFDSGVRVVRLRDGMSLPRMMRGEVRVKDVEKEL